jgi:hypothetical protein
MGAFNVINRAAMAAGQPENVGDVLANFDALATLLNGNVDDFNVKVAAGIARSKLNLTAALIQPGDFAAGSKITTSTLAGGPPAAPADQDIWIATAVDANGARWVFQYNAGSASAFKWEFLGGSNLAAVVATAEATTSGVFTDLATSGPSVTIARAGDYEVGLGYAVSATATGAGNAQAAIFKNGVTQVGFLAYANMVNIAGAVFTPSSITPVLTLAAADVLRIRYLISNGVNTTFQDRRITVRPIRIS